MSPRVACRNAGSPRRSRILARPGETLRRHHVRRVVQLRRRLREALADALRLQPLELHDLDRHGAALPERAVVVEHRRLPAGSQLLEGDVAYHEEGAGAELADQTLDRRLDVLDDVAEVMNRAVEGVIGTGQVRSSTCG